MSGVEYAKDWSDSRARCMAVKHGGRIATHYTPTGHFCVECAERIRGIRYAQAMGFVREFSVATTTAE